MDSHAKVIWAEGILLGQQHFQAWENYWQNQQQLFLHHAHPLTWGIVDLAFDENVVAQGVLKLKRCVALTKNRQWIYYDHTTDGPLTLEIPKDRHDYFDVYLNLPDTNAVTGISGYPEAQRPATWKGYYEAVKDQYDGCREREVLLGRQNLSLSLGARNNGTSTGLAIAKLEYLPQQATYRLSGRYIPPILKVGACDNLLSWLSGFIGLLEQKVKALHQLKSKYGHTGNQLVYSEFIYFNLIKTLSSHLTSLIGIQRLPEFHPYKLYEHCCMLIGALAGFLDEPFEYAEMPDYQHEQLEQVFASFRQCFERLMRQVLPTNTLEVELHRISASEYQSEKLSEETLHQKQFCLAIYHEHMSEAMAKKIESHLKIAAPSKLHEIIQTFTPGLAVRYLEEPGKMLMSKRHFHYFAIDKHSKAWEQVALERCIAFFVNQTLIETPIELVAFDGGAL